MYAIRNKKTKKWVYGTNFRSRHERKYPRSGSVIWNGKDGFNPKSLISYSQFTSFEKALTFETYIEASIAFNYRRCGNDYEIVPVKLFVDGGLFNA